VMEIRRPLAKCMGDDDGGGDMDLNGSTVVGWSDTYRMRVGRRKRTALSERRSAEAWITLSNVSARCNLALMTKLNALDLFDIAGKSMPNWSNSKGQRPTSFRGIP
jgi:hypothetical protein